MATKKVKSNKYILTLKKMNLSQLRAELQKLLFESLNLRMKINEKVPQHDINNLKKNIARCYTFINQHKKDSQLKLKASKK